MNETDYAADAALMQFSQAQNASVSEWTARYPELGRDFALLAADRFAGDGESENEAATARVRAIGARTLAAFHAKQTATVLPFSQSAPLVSLLDKERGITADVLAARLGLPKIYVAKLERRSFAAASVPRSLIAAVADEVRRGFDEVMAFLSVPPAIGTRGMAYKSDAAPALGVQEDFAAALAADAGVSDEAKRRFGGE